jgi:hypothetical protein
VNKQFFNIFQVYDYDWGLRDDFIGEASVDLRKLPENLAQDLLLTLVDTGQLAHGHVHTFVHSGQLDHDLFLTLVNSGHLDHDHLPKLVDLGQLSLDRFLTVVNSGELD